MGCSNNLFVLLPSVSQYHKYRKSFKEVLHQERVLDEARKREAMHATRLNRLQKQVPILTKYIILFTESGAHRRSPVPSSVSGVF